MTLLLRRAVANLFFLILGWGSLSLSATELPDCREAWSELIPHNLHKYDYEHEEQITMVGNIGYSSWYDRTNRSECKKEWTFLVYMAADNDLTPYALADLYEMEAGFKHEHYAASTVKTDLIVQVDTTDDDGIRRLHMFETPEVYRSDLTVDDLFTWEAREVKSPIIGMVDEKPNHRKALESFLKWGIRKYPAKNYAVVVWGHGKGWSASKFAANSLNAYRFGGLLFDSTMERYLSVRDLGTILRRVRYAELDGDPFGLYISDACLMQEAEVAYEISDSARFIMGSPQIHNFLGLPYRRMFYEFNKGTFLGHRRKIYGPNAPRESIDEAYLASWMIPDVYQKSMNSQRGMKGFQGLMDPDGYKDLSFTSISAWELREVFFHSWQKMAVEFQKLIERDSYYANDMVYRMEDIPVFAPGLKDVGLLLDSYTQWIRELQEYEEIDALEAERLMGVLAEVQDALNSTVVNSVVGPAWIENDNARIAFEGFSVWLPGQDQYREHIDDFEKSIFFESREGQPWSLLLKTLFE